MKKILKNITLLSALLSICSASWATVKLNLNIIQDFPSASSLQVLKVGNSNASWNVKAGDAIPASQGEAVSKTITFTESGSFINVNGYVTIGTPDWANYTQIKVVDTAPCLTCTGGKNFKITFTNKGQIQGQKSNYSKSGKTTSYTIKITKP